MQSLSVSNYSQIPTIFAIITVNVGDFILLLKRVKYVEVNLVATILRTMSWYSLHPLLETD